MRAPGWLDMKMVGVKDGRMMVNIRARTWHPGYWWFVLRTLVKAARGNSA